LYFLLEIDLTFAVGANSNNKDTIFPLMKDTMKSIVDKYGIKTIHYSVVNYGADPISNTIIQHSYTEFAQFSTRDQFINVLSSLSPRPGSGDLRLDEATKKCDESFQDPKARQTADKVVVLMIDKDTTQSNLKSLTNTLEAKGIRVIPVGFGNEVTRKQLTTVTTNVYDVIHVDYTILASPLQEQIMNKVFRGK